MSSETFDQAHVYEKLPDDTIRILILEPGAFGEALQGSFKIQQVSHSVEVHGFHYEALSYT
jgi:hypothetical protein